MPEIHCDAPHAVYVPRKGEVNAWDSDAFVAEVRSTGRKTLVMAGVWTSVCVMFPALDSLAAGHDVYAVLDASRDLSEMASRISLARFGQGDVKPTLTTHWCRNSTAAGRARKRPNRRSSTASSRPTMQR